MAIIILSGLLKSDSTESARAPEFGSPLRQFEGHAHEYEHNLLTAQVLRLPTIAAQCLRSPRRRCANAPRTRGFLETLLQAELDEREHRLVEQRIREAHCSG